MKLRKMEGLLKSLLVPFIIYLSGCEIIDAKTLVGSSVISLEDPHPPELPEGYKIFSGDNVAYKIYEKFVNWDDARARCIGDGGNLAITDTSDRINYIKSIYSGPEDSFYVGIRNFGGSNGWTTVENVTISVSSIPWIAPVLTSWLSTLNACALMKLSETGLAEEDCMSLKPFICGISPEKYRLPDVTATQNPLPPTLPEGYSIYSSGNVAYKIYENRTSWKEARSQCILDGGDLAVIDTREKIQYIQNFWKADWLFVGIYKRFNSKEWKAVGDVNLSASSIPWASWYISNYKWYNKYCAAMVVGESNLSAFNCTYSIPFICEIRQDKNHVDVTARTTTTIRPTAISITSETLVNSNCPDGYVELANFRTAYKIYDEYLTHDEARWRCFSYGGRLAVIDSFEKVNSTSTMPIVRSGSVHVGIRTSSANFEEWVIDSNGEPLKDLPWVTENPHPRMCAVLKKDGSGLEDTLCSNRLQYLCEIRQSDDITTAKGIGKVAK